MGSKVSLLTAISKQDLSLFKKLLVKNDVDEVFQAEGPDFGLTPLTYATKTRRYEFVKVLLEHGADVNVTASFRSIYQGNSALHLAAEQDDVEMLLLLLSQSGGGASNLLMNALDESPYLLALRKRSVACLRVLEEHLSLWSGTVQVKAQLSIKAFAERWLVILFEPARDGEYHPMTTATRKVSQTKFPVLYLYRSRDASFPSGTLPLSGSHLDEREEFDGKRVLGLRVSGGTVVSLCPADAAACEALKAVLLSLAAE